MEDVCIFKEGGHLGVDKLAFKGVLVGYLDEGLVEDLSWKDHGLMRVSREPIACKR